MVHHSGLSFGEDSKSGIVIIMGFRELVVDTPLGFAHSSFNCIALFIPEGSPVIQ